MYLTEDNVKIGMRVKHPRCGTCTITKIDPSAYPDSVYKKHLTVEWDNWTDPSVPGTKHTLSKGLVIIRDFWKIEGEVSSLISQARKDIACRGCQRMNDDGIKVCWYCGNAP
jgi:hypothetical protein